MFARSLQGHKIDHIHDPNFNVGKVLSQQVDGRQRFKRGNIPGAGHDHVRLATLIVRSPWPDAYACSAVFDRSFHVQPLQRRLFAGDDDVHIVAAAQAVIGDGEQGVGIGRQIYAYNVSFFIHHVIDESRILVCEAVMILAPNVRGQQIIQRRDRSAPGKVASDFQPLGMLIEHRVDNVDERLIAGKETVAAGEQIAFEPALAHVFA